MSNSYVFVAAPVYKVPLSIGTTKVQIIQVCIGFAMTQYKQRLKNQRNQAEFTLTTNLEANPNEDVVKEIITDHAQSSYNQRHQNSTKKFINLKSKEKVSREKSSFPVITHLIYDDFIETFEKQYHESRPSKKFLVSTIKSIIKLAHGYIIDNGDIVEVYVTDGKLEQEFKVGELRLDNKRFAKVNHYALVPIYAKMDSLRHYVKDKYGVFVRRFLVRNLGSYDNPTAGLKSRNGGVPNNSDYKQMIMKHLRSAQQGQSYFISATATRNPIFGSTGANFYNPTNGRVIIDAAKIPTAKLVDVHSLRAVSNIIGVNELRFNVPFVENDTEYEKNAAARDTVRTREVLIEETVPSTAIVAIQKNNGTWTDLSNTKLSNEEREYYECPI